jgi:hypothetical protein
LAGAAALALSATPALPAQAATDASAAPATAQAANGTLHGHITDPTGALIPGAKVTVLDAKGKAVATTEADAAGAYEVHGLKPGGYVVRAEFAGFAPFQSQLIAMAAGQAKRADITLSIEVEQQNVVVTEDAPTVNTEAGGNANALVLKGKDLEALSDDPDELSNELSALAGPSAGPNGGQIFIDGFSGGQLPPKSAIREIRVNQNPFSAEYDRLGYGRIEILTKPGTDKLHGQFFGMGNTNQMNTGNPFTKSIPDYYSYQFNGTLSGAISKTSSFFFSGERRNIGNVNAWGIPLAVIPDGTGMYVEEPNYGVHLPNERIRTNLSSRIDWQLGSKNTFTARYGFWSETENGNLSAGSLAYIPSESPSTHESNTDHTVQISDAYTINDHMVNETRLQYERQNENHYPDSTLPTISVAGEFTTGGYSGQTYRDHATRLEFQNLTTMSHGAHAIKFGTRLRDSFLSDYTTSNFNGSFRFADANSYLQVANGLAQGKTFNQLVAEGFGPITAGYTSGTASAKANMFDAALYLQDDWKVNQRFTVSGGLRWETQNHIADHNDWAPRVGMAYALDGGKGKQAKTVLRAGFGMFYDRFSAGNLLNVHHLDLQNKIVLNNPTCNDATATSLNNINFSTCESGPGASTNASSPVRYRVASDFHSPYTMQIGGSIERQLTKTANMSVTYLHSFGPHQLVTINANQWNPTTGDYPLDSGGGYIYEYDPEAVYKQNQVITSVNATITKRLSVVGFYTAGWADSSGGAGTNASNAYDISQDYGPATFTSRNQIFAMANYAGPWGLRFNPFLIANSGKPFNITLPTDPVNDFYNQRPRWATSGTAATDVVNTPWGAMDKNPNAAGDLIPANIGVGPAAVAVNVRVSRGFGFGPETGGSGPNDMGPGGPGGPGGGGHRGGPPGGGLGPGGLGGGPGGMRGMFGGGTNRKYNLNLSVQALNLFNNINYGGPNGTIGAPGFLQSTTLAGGIFSTSAASRRIFVQATFSF